MQYVQKRLLMNINFYQDHFLNIKMTKVSLKKNILVEEIRLLEKLL
jgi:hypothetical protein